MKISTEIASASKILGEEKAIEYIAKAGFDAWDFSMFDMARYDREKGYLVPTEHPLSSDGYLKFARKLKQIGLDNGIECNQSHAPFPTYAKKSRVWLLRSIECTAEAGGKICVIHPDNNRSPEENAQMYFELIDFAKQYGVKIATENMWNWAHGASHASPAACSDPESFNAHLDAVNDEYLTACLDIGHAEMAGLNTSAVEMIHALGKRLGALHIHDNDMVHDSHQIPFSMNIDFSPIVKALRDVDYKGYFTLEADSFLKDYNEDNVFDGVTKLADSARKLAEEFDKL